MPVTRRGNPLYDNIDQTNAAGFLFRDDESNMDSNYTGIDTSGDDGFPKMLPSKANPNRVSNFIALVYCTMVLCLLFVSLPFASSSMTRQAYELVHDIWFRFGSHLSCGPSCLAAVPVPLLPFSPCNLPLPSQDPAA